MNRARHQGSSMYIRHLAAIVLASSTALAPLVRAQAHAPAQDAQQSGGQAPADRQSFRFRTGVELINVNATVTDPSGRFVPGLRKEDFRIFEDDQPQEITHF